MAYGKKTVSQSGTESPNASVCKRGCEVKRDAGGLADPVSGVNDHDRRKGVSNDLLSCTHYPL